MEVCVCRGVAGGGGSGEGGAHITRSTCSAGSARTERDARIFRARPALPPSCRWEGAAGPAESPGAASPSTPAARVAMAALTDARRKATRSRARRRSVARTAVTKPRHSCRLVARAWLCCRCAMSTSAVMSAHRVDWAESLIRALARSIT